MIFTRTTGRVKLSMRKVAAGQRLGRVPRRQLASRGEEVTMSRIMRIALAALAALSIAAANGELIWPR